MSEPAEAADAVVAAIHSGDLAGLRQLLGDHPPPEQVSEAFLARPLRRATPRRRIPLARGADPNGVPDYAKGTPLDAAAGQGTQRDNLISWLRDHGARPEQPNA